MGSLPSRFHEVRINTMAQVIAVVEKGQIKLPPDVRLPDGLKVLVIWGEDDEHLAVPYDRKPLTEEDVSAELHWATGDHFRQ